MSSESKNEIVRDELHLRPPSVSVLCTQLNKQKTPFKHTDFPLSPDPT
jgi:hypothetical protein